jgi:hypothetical protein
VQNPNRTFSVLITLHLTPVLLYSYRKMVSGVCVVLTFCSEECLITKTTQKAPGLPTHAVRHNASVGKQRNKPVSLNDRGLRT